MRLMNRQPAYDAATYADAQALVDDGLDVQFVLSLYPKDAAWLGPMLEAAGAFIDATRMEQPSYYFESSLKQKFLQAAEQRSRKPIPLDIPEAPRPYARMRTTFAGAAVAGVAVVAGVITLGLITADGTTPGDWRQVFRQDSAASGRARFDLQLKETEARIQVIREQVTSGGEVTSSDLQQFQQVTAELRKLAEDRPLDDEQKAKFKTFGETSNAVLLDVKQKQPNLAPLVDDTIPKVNDAVAAGLGTVKPIDTSTPPPSQTPTPTATPTETGTPTPTGTATPSETPTPGTTPTASATPEEPSATATPTASATADASATSTPGQ